jgi:hypothetical protein
VLEAALPKVTVLPFRFGTIYSDDAHVRAMLAEHPEFRETLSRLEGKVELGVKAFFDRAVFRARFAEQRGVDAEAPVSGRAYMQQKQLEREIDEAGRTFVAACARDSHGALAAAAEDGRVNPVQLVAPTRGDQEMVLNGAYLVPTADEQRFIDALDSLRERYALDGVAYELTGPWPPYNFVGERDE